MKWLTTHAHLSVACWCGRKSCAENMCSGTDVSKTKGLSSNCLRQYLTSPHFPCKVQGLDGKSTISRGPLRSSTSARYRNTNNNISDVASTKNMNTRIQGIAAPDWRILCAAADTEREIVSTQLSNEKIDFRDEESNCACAAKRAGRNGAVCGQGCCPLR